MSRLLQLELDARHHPTIIVQEIATVLKRHPGHDPFLLRARIRGGGEVKLRYGDELRVAGTDPLLHMELEDLTGSQPHFAWDE